MSSGFEDTISSASAYYNNQYRVDPGFVQGYAKIHQREMKDTLETKQQRLERHLETQFQLNQQVPGGKIVLIVQVGKYAILALVMPPFYLFYEGPRWILITIQPFILIAFEKAGAFLLIISTFGIDFWAGLGKKMQFFKKPKDFLKEKIKVLNQAVFNRAAALGMKLYQIFQPLNQVLEKLKSYVPAFREKKAAFVHFLKILPLLLQKKIEEQKEGFKTAIKEKAAVLIALLAQVQVPFIAAKKILDPVIVLVQKQVIKAVSPAIKVVSLVLATIKSAVKKLWDQSLKQSRILGNIIALPFNLAIKAVEAPFKNTVKRVERGLISLKGKVSNQLEVLGKLVKLTAVTAGIPMRRGFIQIRNITEQVGLNLIQKAKVVLERLKKMQPIVKRVVKTLWDEGKKHSKKGFAKFKKIVVLSTQSIAKALIWGFEKIGRIPSSLYVVWKKIQKWIGRLAKRAVWALRVTLAWTKVILRYSLAHLWD